MCTIKKYQKDICLLLLNLPNINYILYTLVLVVKTINKSSLLPASVSLLSVLSSFIVSLSILKSHCWESHCVSLCYPCCPSLYHLQLYYTHSVMHRPGLYRAFIGLYTVLRWLFAPLNSQVLSLVCTAWCWRALSWCFHQTALAPGAHSWAVTVNAKAVFMYAKYYFFPMQII